MATIAQHRQPPHMLRYGLAVVVILVILASLIIGTVILVQMNNHYRWGTQYSESVSTLEVFCNKNLTKVADAACRDWAQQSVNADLSITDAVLLCDRMFWNGSTSGRDQDAFVSCLARAGVYIPQ